MMARTASRRRPLHIGLTCVVFAGLGLGCAWLYGHAAEWWDAKEHERIREVLRSTNPGARQNDAAIEAVFATASTSPVWEAPPARERTAATKSDDGKTAGSEQGHGADEDWANLPRTSFTLASTLVDDSSTRSADFLFRNRHLNPSDHYIPPPERAALAQWLAVKNPLLAQLRATVDEVAAQELNFMIDHGMARHVAYADFRAARTPAEKALVAEQLASVRAALEAAGAAPAEVEDSLRDTKIFDDAEIVAGAFSYATRSGNDRIFLGDLQRMPQTQTAAEIYVVFCMELHDGVLRFFREAGCLDEAAVHRILREVEAALGRFRVK